jgi:hypothetical protein
VSGIEIKKPEGPAVYLKQHRVLSDSIIDRK